MDRKTPDIKYNIDSVKIKKEIVIKRESIINNPSQENHDKEQYCTTMNCNYCKYYQKRVISFQLSDGSWWIVGEYDNINKANEHIKKFFSDNDTYVINKKIHNKELNPYRVNYYIEKGFITVM